MISLAPGTKVFLACRPVDLRDTLSKIAGGHPISRIDELMPWAAGTEQRR